MRLNRNIVLIGMPGSGKTTISKKISSKLNLKIVSIDKYMEEKEGKTVREIFKADEAYFRELEARTVEEVSKEEGIVIDTGGGIVKNPKNIQFLKEKGFIVFVNRPLEHILSDLDVINRPLFKNGKETVYKLFDERYELYKSSCDYELINDRDLEDVINTLIEVIEEKIETN